MGLSLRGGARSKNSFVYPYGAIPMGLSPWGGARPKNSFAYPYGAIPMGVSLWAYPCGGVPTLKVIHIFLVDLGVEGDRKINRKSMKTPIKKQMRFCNGF